MTISNLKRVEIFWKLYHAKKMTKQTLQTFSKKFSVFTGICFLIITSTILLLEEK